MVCAGSPIKPGWSDLEVEISLELTIVRWSFGGNRLQIKAEIRVMADVDAALRAISYIGFKAEGDLQPLKAKQELLHTLLENEQIRLLVWLYPLDHGVRHILPSRHLGRTPQEVSLADSTLPLQCID